MANDEEEDQSLDGTAAWRDLKKAGTNSQEWKDIADNRQRSRETTRKADEAFSDTDPTPQGEKYMIDVWNTVPLGPDMFHLATVQRIARLFNRMIANENS